MRRFSFRGVSKIGYFIILCCTRMNYWFRVVSKRKYIIDTFFWRLLNNILCTLFIQKDVVYLCILITSSNALTIYLLLYEIRQND